MKTYHYLFLMLTMFASATQAENTAHWSYEGKAGPENWSSLSEAFSTCKTGKYQSPIDIKNALSADLPPLKINFHTIAETVENNGHTIQVTVNDEDDFPLDNDTFQLRQYHFHSPSENFINGKEYPLEAHFVHENSKGELAVLAVMFEVGKENAALDPILDKMPLTLNHPVPLGKHLNLNQLFPDNHHYYRYSGSLTTPPCTEGVRWLVMKEPVTLSAEQLAKFQHALQHTNNRPLQPLNGRVIIN